MEDHMTKCFWPPVLVLVVFMSAPRASAVSSALLRGETPSDKAHQITGKASNSWTPAASARMKVYNPRTGLVYTKDQFNQLPIGTVVEFPDEMAIARPTQVSSKSVNQICADFIVDAATASCADRLIRRHRLARIIPGLTPDTAITRELWIPVVWQVRTAPPVPLVETPAPVVQTPGLWTRVLDWLAQYWLVPTLILGLLLIAYLLRDRWVWRIKRKLRNGQPEIFANGVKHESLADVQTRRGPPPAETPP